MTSTYEFIKNILNINEEISKNFKKIHFNQKDLEMHYNRFMLKKFNNRIMLISILITCFHFFIILNGYLTIGIDKSFYFSGMILLIDIFLFFTFLIVYLKNSIKTNKQLENSRFILYVRVVLLILENFFSIFLVYFSDNEKSKYFIIKLFYFLITVKNMSYLIILPENFYFSVILHVCSVFCILFIFLSSCVYIGNNVSNNDVNSTYEYSMLNHTESNIFNASYTRDQIFHQMNVEVKTRLNIFDIMIEMFLFLGTYFLKRLINIESREFYLEKFKFEYIFKYCDELIGGLNGYHVSFFKFKAAFISQRLKHFLSTKYQSYFVKKNDLNYYFLNLKTNNYLNIIDEHDNGFKATSPCTHPQSQPNNTLISHRFDSYLSFKKLGTIKNFNNDNKSIKEYNEKNNLCQNNINKTKMAFRIKKGFLDKEIDEEFLLYEFFKNLKNCSCEQENLLDKIKNLQEKKYGINKLKNKKSNIYKNDNNNKGSSNNIGSLMTTHKFVSSEEKVKPSILSKNTIKNISETIKNPDYSYSGDNPNTYNNNHNEIDKHHFTNSDFNYFANQTEKNLLKHEPSNLNINKEPYNSCFNEKSNDVYLKLNSPHKYSTENEFFNQPEKQNDNFNITKNPLNNENNTTTNHKLKSRRSIDKFASNSNIKSEENYKAQIDSKNKFKTSENTNKEKLNLYYINTSNLNSIVYDGSNKDYIISNIQGDSGQDSSAEDNEKEIDNDDNFADKNNFGNPNLTVNEKNFLMNHQNLKESKLSKFSKITNNLKLDIECDIRISSNINNIHDQKGKITNNNIINFNLKDIGNKNSNSDDYYVNKKNYNNNNNKSSNRQGLDVLETNISKISRKDKDKEIVQIEYLKECKNGRPLDDNKTQRNKDNVKTKNTNNPIESKKSKKYDKMKKFKMLGEFYIEFEDRKKFYTVYYRQINNVLDIFFYDYTKIKEAENISSENKIKHKILSKIAHEFKTPLNSILSLINNLKLISKNYLINRELNIIQSLSNYTIYLISDLIQYASNDIKTPHKKIGESGINQFKSPADENPDKIKVSEKINNLNIFIRKIEIKKCLFFCFDILNALISCHENKKDFIKTELYIEDKLNSFNIFSDEIRINQILLNFISNSVKFTKKGKIAVIANFVNKKYIKNSHLNNNKSNSFSPNKKDKQKEYFKNNTNTYDIGNQTSNFRRYNNNLNYNDNDNSNFPVNDKKNSHLEKLYFKISIVDTGLGISEEQQKMLFHQEIKMNTDHEFNHQGSGLGLSICASMVKLLNLKIEFASRENYGSVFSILIPAVKLEQISGNNFNNLNSNLNANNILNNHPSPHPVNIPNNLNVFRQNSVQSKKNLLQVSRNFSNKNTYNPTTNLLNLNSFNNENVRYLFSSKKYNKILSSSPDELKDKISHPKNSLSVNDRNHTIENNRMNSFFKIFDKTRTNSNYYKNPTGNANIINYDNTSSCKNKKKRIKESLSLNNLNINNFRRKDFIKNSIINEPNKKNKFNKYSNVDFLKSSQLNLELPRQFSNHTGKLYQIDRIETRGIGNVKNSLLTEKIDLSNRKLNNRLRVNYPIKTYTVDQLSDNSKGTTKKRLSDKINKSLASRENSQNQSYDPYIANSCFNNDFTTSQMQQSMLKNSNYFNSSNYNINQNNNSNKIINNNSNIQKSLNHSLTQKNSNIPSSQRKENLPKIKYVGFKNNCKKSCANNDNNYVCIDKCNCGIVNLNITEKFKNMQIVKSNFFQGKNAKNGFDEIRNKAWNLDSVTDNITNNNIIELSASSF